MAQTHETKLRISADDRDLKNIGRTIKESFDPRVIQQFERALERSNRDVAQMGSAMDRVGASARRLGGSAPQRAGAAAGAQRDGRGRFVGGSGGRGGGGPRTSSGGGSGPGPGRGGGFWPTFAGAGVGSYLGSRMAQAGAIGGSIARGQGVFEQLFGAIPLVGGALSGAIGGAQDLYQQHVAERQAAAGAFAQTGVGRLPRDQWRDGELVKPGFMGDAARLGLAGPAAYQALGQIGQQTGVKGQKLFAGSGGGLASTLLQHQKMFGANTGSLLGAAGTAGGEFSAGEGQAMASEAMRDGLVAGFREARLGEFVQQVTSEVQALRTQGIMIQPQQIQDLITGFSGFGASFKGEAGAAAAKDARSRMQGLIQGGGVESMIGLMAARKAKGDVSYYGARQFLEESPEKAVPQVVDVIKNRMGLTGEAGMFMLEKVLPGRSVKQYRDMMSGQFGATDTPEARARAQDQIRARAGVAGEEGAFGRAARVAGRTNRRAGMGAQVAGSVEAMQDVEDEIAAAVTVPLAQFVGGVAEEIKNLIKSVEGKSIEDLFSVLTDKFKKALNKAVDFDFDGDLPDLPDEEDRNTPEYKAAVSKRQERVRQYNIEHGITTPGGGGAATAGRSQEEQERVRQRNTAGRSPADDLDAASQHLGEASRKIREQDSKQLPPESEVRGGR